MKQMTFLDGPIVRKADPVTSHTAAEDIQPKLTGLRAEFVRRVKLWIEKFDTWPTSNEIAQGNESLRKRGLECIRAGWLREAPIRKCTVTGKLCRTFDTVDDK